MQSPRAAFSIPFAHLNLRRNPFGQFSPDEIASLADVEIDEIVAQMDDPRFAVQFVGEKGYGKTTHLLAIRARFPASGYVHLAEETQSRIPPGSPLLIDEAQRLTWRQRRRVFRPGAPLAMGTHVDYRGALVRAGRRVETVEVGARMTSHRLYDLLNAGVRWVRRHDGPLPEIRQETARRLLAQFGPDVRRIQRELYLTFQNMGRIQDV